MGSIGLWADQTIKRSDTFEWESAKIRAASNLFDENTKQKQAKCTKKTKLLQSNEHSVGKNTKSRADGKKQENSGLLPDYGGKDWQLQRREKDIDM